MKWKLDFDHPNYPDDSAVCVLGNCEDFKNEIGAIEEVVAERNVHIVLNSPKGHPEIAGVGIEFDWGCLKRFLGKKNNHVLKKM